MRGEGKERRREGEREPGEDGTVKCDRPRPPADPSWPKVERFPACEGQDRFHDLGDPLAAARHAANALAPDGTVMLVEPFAGDTVEENLNPIGRLYYGFSTLVCTPGSLSQPGAAGLGTQAGQARIAEVLRTAGFGEVRRAAESPLNLVLEARLP